MKVVSFNINSVRQHQPQLSEVATKIQPDIIGLQEIKVHSDNYPAGLLPEDEYLCYHFGQKTHYGVAFYTKIKPEAVYYGFPGDDEDAQRRLITMDIKDPKLGMVRVINGYFPQGENIKHEVKFPAKRKFYHDLFEYIKSTPKDYKIIVMGDFNISPLDLDIGIGPRNARTWLRTGKCSFQPEEREWMDELYKLGMVDTFRHLYPELEEHYSWFDYRSKGILENRGLRIDLVMCSQNLVEHLTESAIDIEIRKMENVADMKSPSDHAPVWANFE